MGAPCATGARASRQSPLRGALDPPYCTVPLYSISPCPSRQRTPHLPFHSMLEPAWLVPVLVPPRLHLGAGLLIVSKNFSPETHTASPFPPEFYLHCKW